MLNEVESGLNMLAFVPLTVTLLTLRVAVPLFEIEIDLVVDELTFTDPKLNEDGATISGPELDC